MHVNDFLKNKTALEASRGDRGGSAAKIGRLRRTNLHAVVPKADPWVLMGAAAPLVRAHIS